MNDAKLTQLVTGLETIVDRRLSRRERREIEALCNRLFEADLTPFGPVQRGSYEPTEAEIQQGIEDAQAGLAELAERGER